ncbi:hypothetical protein FOA52_015483 [Chlamydomonas sp. UWO 241]|nr:hypothetical protein FOA52_015483 [Chlamydomonas sp. UWO 241]
MRFYRFVFHLCKEPRRKHMQTDVAIELWRLVLSGRFRLLDRFCAFAEARPAGELRVVTEDQWRQVLDFSRAVHEDLSNYDAGGAWVCLLDEFVDHVRSTTGTCSHAECDCHLSGFGSNDGLGALMGSGSGGEGGHAPGCHTRVVPHSGSKRRSPDIDSVAQQMGGLAMPLSAAGGSMPAMPAGPMQMHMHGQGHVGGTRLAHAHSAPTLLLQQQAAQHAEQQAAQQQGGLLGQYHGSHHAAAAVPGVAHMSPHHLPTKRLRGGIGSGAPGSTSGSGHHHHHHAATSAFEAASVSYAHSGELMAASSPSPSRSFSGSPTPHGPWSLGRESLLGGLHAAPGLPHGHNHGLLASSPPPLGLGSQEMVSPPSSLLHHPHAVLHTHSHPHLGAHAPSSLSLLAGMSPSGSLMLPEEMLPNLQPIATGTPRERRTVRTRRSGVADLLNASVTDALFGP